MFSISTSTFDRLHVLGLSRREMQVIENGFGDRDSDYRRTALGALSPGWPRRTRTKARLER